MRIPAGESQPMLVSGSSDPDVVLGNGATLLLEPILDGSVEARRLFIAREHRTDGNEISDSLHVLPNATRLLRSENQLTEDNCIEEGFQSAALSHREIDLAFENRNNDVGIEEVSTTHRARPVRNPAQWLRASPAPIPCPACRSR